jgi:hypothetical protein
MWTAFSQLFGQLPAILALHWSQQRSHEATGTSPSFGPAKMWPDALLHLGHFLDRLLEHRFFREVLPALRFVRAHLLSLLASRVPHLPPKWGCSTENVFGDTKRRDCTGPSSITSRRPSEAKLSGALPTGAGLEKADCTSDILTDNLTPSWHAVLFFLRLA